MVELLIVVGYSYMGVILIKYTYMTWVLGIPKDEVLASFDRE